MKRFLPRLAAIAALLFAMADPCLAQTVPCQISPTLNGNCVPTVQYTPGFGAIGYLPITNGQRVELVPAGKLVDTFNDPSVLDTTNTWNTPTTNGSGSATYSQGQEVLSSGTTTGSYAYLRSQALFQINSPALLLFRGAINAQAEVAGDCKEIGFFLIGGTVVCNTPVTDGVVFEITATTAFTGTGAGTNLTTSSVTGTQLVPGMVIAGTGVPTGTTIVSQTSGTSGGAGVYVTSLPTTSSGAALTVTGGKLQAVTYATGVRALIADLSVPNSFTPNFPAVVASDGTGTILCPARSIPQAGLGTTASPTETCPHILDIWFNGNSAEWDIDGQPVAFMRVGSLGPANNALPWAALTINAANSAATTIKINQTAVGDEARNSNKLCDPLYGWRCMGIGATGSIFPPIPQTSVTASATGTTGAVTATLGSVAGKTTYLCTVQIGEAGTGTATATAGNTITGTINYVVTAPGNFTVTYTPCVPANAAATSIPVATAANASATAVAVTATGYQQ
jgi:hypothetical protein